MKRILIAGAIAAGVLGLAAPAAQAAPIGKPDGLIKLPDTPFIGNNIYNADGDDQTKCKIGTTSTFLVRFQNDGQGKDRYTVFYFPDNQAGVESTLFFKGEDVTDEAIAQTFKLPKVKPGAKTKALKLDVSITGTPGSPSDALIGARSKHSPFPADIVKAIYNTNAFCTL